MFLIDKIIHCYENINPFQSILVISVIFLYTLYLFVRDIDVPPGPRGSPIFGYWPFLESDTCHLHLQKLSKTYGDVFSFRAAGTLFIHLGSIKAVREAHMTKSECFGQRYPDSILSDAFGEGVTFAKSEPWKVLRKFFVSKLKECGLNAVKGNTANSVYDALKKTVEELHNFRSRPIPLYDMITSKYITIIRRIIFNDEGIKKEELEEINNAYGEMMRGMTGTNLLLIGKFAKYCMFPFMPSIWELNSHNKRIHSILLDVVNRHKSEYNESNIADLIDSYFKERDDRRKKGDTTAKYFTDKALVGSLNQFATDGNQAIGIFIVQFILTLLKHPEEQDKMYKEILDVIGKERLPTIEDKTKLPYTNAFMYEVIRLSDFFPLLPSLQCTKETTVQGYKIPEGSITLINFYSAHRNPDDFENPDQFNPSRYLPASGKERPELPILFGIGKRSCMGEGFSMVTAFLFLATIVQNFRLSFPEGSEVSSAMFWSTDKLEICVHPRHQKSH